MPTSSTAKILVAKHQKQMAKMNPPPSQGLTSTHQAQQPLFVPNKRMRPRSCKYDTYRLRSRTSIVEENLFGEPLKNKLIMSRSKSLEAIAQQGLAEAGKATADSYPVAQTPGTKRRRPHGGNEGTFRSGGQERPRTALATMRQPFKIAGNEDTARLPQALLEQPQSEPPPGCLMLSRRDFERIRRAAQTLDQNPGTEPSVSWKDSADQRLTAAPNLAFCPETSAADFPGHETEMDREARLRDHHILERAQDLKMEQQPEVQKLNELILEAKCNAIRDIQRDEKDVRLHEVIQHKRELEATIEEERKQAEEMAAQRVTKLAELNKDFRECLDRQKAENEARRLLEMEQIRLEVEHQQKLKDEEKERLRREVAEKKAKLVQHQQQTLADVQEARRRKAAEDEEERLKDERIRELQSVRRGAEIRKEEEEKRARKEKERQMGQMKKAVEQERELMQKREEVRLIRQREEEDRAWRQRELEKARAKAEKDEELARVRDAQMKHRMENAAKAVEQERLFWEDVQRSWQDEALQEKTALEENAKRKRSYLTDLQNQMEKEVREKAQAFKNHQEADAAQEKARNLREEGLHEVRDRKLQQLRAYNVPERYIREVEKKCQRAQKARFTFAYFGLK